MNLIIILFSILAYAQTPAPMKLTSAAIKQGGTIAAAQVFNGMDCTGLNISPDLTWSKGPAGTKFYAVTMYDPDAPTGSGWWHWLVFNIPATVTSLPVGAKAP